MLHAPTLSVGLPEGEPSRFALGAPGRERRVPDDLRQRSEISCDRCKKRKRKCKRQTDSVGCDSCQEAATECLTTFPRKRQVIASQASARYATLDAIVRKLYPDADIDSQAGLDKLACDLGAIKGSGNRQNRAEEEEDQTEGGSRQGLIAASGMPEGWLVPAPRGGHHYVGPASLIYFSRCARQLVSKSKFHRQPIFDEAGTRRFLQASAFTTYKTSHTIEANIQDHPAAFAAGTKGSPSSGPNFGDTEWSRQSSGGDAFRHIRLPCRRTADSLVDAYFQRVHLNIPILHRVTFSVLYESAFQKNTIDLALEPGKACILYMVFTLGAQALEGQLPTALAVQQQYLAIVIREGLGRLVLTSALANVQALILLALYQHNAGERNTAYILIGHAIRAAVSSGLHKDGDNHEFVDRLERNSRRTVWWYLHIFEQTISLALGRPSFTDQIQVNTALPDATYQEGIGLPPGYLEAYVSLSQFVVRIKHTVGMVSVHYENTSLLVRHYENVLELHTVLIAWKKGLSSGLSLGQKFTTPEHRRLIVLLQVWADYFESVLCRPYLLCRVDQDIGKHSRPAEIDEIAEYAVSAAHASVTKLLILSGRGLLEGSVWLDFYAVQHAIMVLSLQFLGQPDGTEWEDSREPISQLISVSQTMRLAPTYRITMNVALQLSCISGIGPDIPVALGATTGTPGSPDQVYDPTLQSFGPFPPAVHQAYEPAIFSDLYNLGYNNESAHPWDFFGLADFTEDWLNPVPDMVGVVPDDLPEL